jgi:hypothetical protein
LIFAAAFKEAAVPTGKFPPKPKRETPDPKKRGRPPGSLSKPKPKTPIQRLGYRPYEYAAAFGISRSTVYEGIKRGQLKTKKIGNCMVILLDAAGD